MRQLIRVVLIFALACWSHSAMAARIVLVAGGGEKADGGPAEQVKLNGPFGVDFDSHGTMFIIEMTGNRLWSGEAGMLRLRSGNGEKGERGDGGPAEKAQLNGPHNLLVLPND